jgi:hypothetical protein
MSVAFKPDKYDVVVTNKYTSLSGRWISFLGTHWDGRDQCWDVGFFQTTSGAVQRLHFKSNKTGAVIQYDEARAFLTDKRRNRESEASEDRYHIFGPSDKGNVS